MVVAGRQIIGIETCAVMPQLPVIEAPEHYTVLTPVAVFEPEGAAGRLELGLVGIDRRGRGELPVDRLQPTGDWIIYHHEIAGSGQIHEEIHADQLTSVDLHGR